MKTPWMRTAALVLALGMAGGCTWKSEADDWKNKFIQEAKYHHLTQVVKSAEIANLGMKIAEQEVEIRRLQAEVARLNNSK